MASDHLILLADIGATNARFAISNKQAQISRVESFQCSDFASLEAATDFYLGSHNLNQIKSFCIAIAGIAHKKIIKVTNNHWVLDREALRAKYNLETVAVLNDFEAIALSLPFLSSKQLMGIGNKHCKRINSNGHYSYATLGAGTGLGMAALVKSGSNLLPIVSEGGHASFSPTNELQINILKTLKMFHEQISNEMLLSGPGIINIYKSICLVEDVPQIYHTASEISEAAIQEKEGMCIKTIEVFFEILAQVAGDLTLIFGSFDGVYLAGGVVQRNSVLINEKRFRRAFESKSQHCEELGSTPVYLITETNPGLLGANYYSAQL